MEKIFSFAKFSKSRDKRLKKLCKLQCGEFVIYHGENYDFDPKDYYSWTLDYSIAEFFAFRFGARGKVHQEKITCSQAIDFIEIRGESEILFDIYENQKK